MSTTSNDKMRFIGLLALFASCIYWPATPVWASGFTPVSQCFRDTGAPGWIMQLYDSGIKNSTIPLTAASGVDVAGSGWLRLTDATGNKSGNAYYTLPINVTQLGIQAQFSYTAWGGSGADGISLYLFDGATTPANFVQGVFGGGLGYCQQNNYGGSSSSTSPKTYVYGAPSTNKFELKNLTGGTTLPGLSNAVVGVGIDDYGNFANNNDRCSNFGESGRTNMNSSNNLSYGTIGVRGPGNGQNGYDWLADTNNSTTPNSTPTWYQTSTSTRPTASQFYRNVKVNISPATVGSASSYTVKTSWQTVQNGAYTQLLSASYPGMAFPITGTTSANTTSSPYLTVNPPANSTAPYNNASTGIFKGDFFQLPTTTGDVWNPLPPKVKFGFGASTGGSTNYHEIQDAFFTEGLPDLAITQNDPSASGGMGTFQVTVTNLGSTIATNATFSATFSGLSNVLWSCIPSAGSSCPATNGSGAVSNANFSLGIVGNVTFIFKGQAVAGSTISDTVSIAGASGFNDADTTSDTSTASMTIGSSPTHLNLSQLPQTSDSAANNTVTGGQVQTSTQVYIAMYHPANWWGGLAAYNLVSSGTGTSATLTGLASLANWDAGCKLTGGSCTTTGTTYTATTPSSRAILTWNGATGIPFAWTNLNTVEGTALSTDPAIASSSYKCGASGTTTCNGSDVVDYLIGGRTNEQGDTSPGPFRTRTGVLGDIIDSNPVFVGKPAANYPTTAPWSDLLYPTQAMPENVTTNSYTAYKTARATRMNIAYIASNDGMVHGFRSGKYDSSGTVYDATTNDGLELLAYMPGVVLTSIAQNNATAFATNYNFTDPAYTHHFFVNASPGTNDLYYTNAWHTWLVGGLGGGGQAIYALDITDPTNFSQSNAANLVVKELNMANMTCNNVPACANNLGWTYGTPIIRRMHNGTWAVIFGNGYNSTNGYAAVFVATINSSTGAWSVYELQTNGQLPNGINYVNSADLDRDNVTDYLYAGDLFGNVWRFDVTSSNPATWSASKFGASSAQPLFTATNASGIAQPITTSIQIQPILQNGVSRAIIMFGTGKNLEASDLLPDNTTHGVQTIYGAWDWDMTAWNAASSKKFASLTAPQTITRSNMQQQTVTGTYDSSGGTFTSSSTSGYRTLSGATVCWQGSTGCSTNQLGFYLDLPSLGEEVIYNSIMVNNLFTVNTTIPSAQTRGMTCYPPTPPGGWTMAINPLNGGVIMSGGSVFSDSSGNFTKINSSPVSGSYVSAVGTPSMVTFNNSTYLLNKTTSSTVVVQKVQANLSSIPTGRRISWIELR